MSAGLDVQGAVLAALAVTVLLVALHLLAPRVHELPGVPQRAVGSFAGGTAVAYVFLHLLPEIAQGSREVGEVLGDVVQVTPLLDLAVFLLALTGFAALYGLERLAVRTGSGRHPDGADDQDPPVGVFWVHLGSYAVYNVLITYTMVLRFRTGVAYALLFTLAMGLHFVLTDRGLAEHYPRRFRREGRFLLAGALVLGWALAALLAPTSTLVVVLLTALLGGGILLNVFKEELPSASGRSSYPWFLAGLGVYAAVLTAVTAASG